MFRVFRFSLGGWVCLSPWWSSTSWGWRQHGSPWWRRWFWLWLGLWWWSWLMWWRRWQHRSGWQRYRPYINLAWICSQWRRFSLRSQRWCFAFQGVCITRSWGWRWPRSAAWCWVLLLRLQRLAWITRLSYLFAFLPLLGLLQLGVFLGFRGLHLLCLLGFLPGWWPHGSPFSPIRLGCWALLRSFP